MKMRLGGEGLPLHSSGTKFLFSFLINMISFTVMVKMMMRRIALLFSNLQSEERLGLERQMMADDEISSTVRARKISLLLGKF